MEEQYGVLSYGDTYNRRSYRLHIATVRVHLDSITFGDDIAFKFKNINRLRRIFELQDCIRLDPANYLSAEIEADLLERFLHASSLSRSQIASWAGDIPPLLRLPPQYALLCAEGQSRIAAAKSTLHGVNRWWPVKLHLKGFGSPS